MPKRVLVVAPEVPRPDAASGDRRFFGILRAISAEHDVDLLVVERPESADADGYERAVEELGVRMLPRGRRALHRALARTRYHAVLFEFHHIALRRIELVRRVQPWALRIVDSVDVHFARERTGKEFGASDCQDPERTRRQELRVYRAADVVLTVTSEDDLLLEREGGIPERFLVPNMVPIRPRSRTTRANELVFVGGFKHSPNVDGIGWFVRESWPSIRRAFPDAVLNVVGADAPPSVAALAEQPGVRVLGFVPDTSELLDRAAVSVAPLRFGAGMKGKVSEALARGIPVVTTSIGAQGFHVRTGVHLLLADTADGFSEAVIALLTDTRLRERIGESGQRIAAAVCAEDLVQRDVRSMMARLLEGLRIPAISPGWLVHCIRQAGRTLARQARPPKSRRD